MLVINDAISIPFSELKFTFSRSPGPGGQHVNKTSTKATLSFNVERTRSLSPLQKMIVKGKLRRRIGKDGILHISAHDTRSQADNRELVLKRFMELLREALEPVLDRINSRVPRSQKRRRLDDKKRRGQVKQLRGTPRRGGDQ